MMLPKMSTYVKSYGEIKWMYFLIEDDELLKNIFGRKPAIALKKNLIVNPSTMKFFWKPK